MFSFCSLFSIQHLGEPEPCGESHPARHLEGQHRVEVVALLSLGLAVIVTSSSSTPATAISTPRGGNSNNTVEEGDKKNLNIVNVTLILKLNI